MTEVNSNMLPSGSRPAAIPRSTIDRMCTTQPTTVTASAAAPNRSPQGAFRALDGGTWPYPAGSGPAVGTIGTPSGRPSRVSAPAGTSSADARVVLVRRDANSTAAQANAIVYAAVAAPKAWSDKAPRVSLIAMAPT